MMEGLRKRHSSKPSSTSPPVVVAAPSGVPTGNSAARNASGSSISSSNFFLVTQKIFLMLFLLLFAFLISIAVVMGIGFLVFPAYTPAINGSNSISLLTEIEIGGANQSVLFRGQNVNNPILLFLHGGPGLPLMPLHSAFAQELEEDFVVVHWDQYGSGKSCGLDFMLLDAKKIQQHEHEADEEEEQEPDQLDDEESEAIKRKRKARDMPFVKRHSLEEEKTKDVCLEAYVEDTHELIQHLLKQFNKDKLVLVGHDWGTILGLKVAHKYPNLVSAYVSVGQIVNFEQQEKTSHAYLTRMAKKKNEAKKLHELQDISVPYPQVSQYFKSRQLIMRLNGDYKNGGFLLRYLHLLFASHEYSARDKVMTVPCILKSGQLFFHEFANKSQAINFLEEVKEVEVPIYFFTGKYDKIADNKMIKQYYEDIKAPHKEFVQFNRSAHWPFLEEVELFQTQLLKLQ